MSTASDNYKKNKNRKRTVPDLDDNQIRKLVELMARNASFGEIARVLDLSEIDLDIIQHRLSLHSMEEAKKRLASYEFEDRQNQADLDAKREQIRLDHQAAQERLDKRLAAEAAENKKHLSAAQDAARSRAASVQDEDADRQKRFVNEKPKTKDLLEQYRAPSTRYVGASVRSHKDDSKFPETLETAQLREMLLHRGLSFIRDQFNVTDADIRVEMSDRGISLDFDLLPR